jgi:hypothetical protein
MSTLTTASTSAVNPAFTPHPVPPPHPSIQPTTILPSPSELSSGRLSEHNLELAVRAVVTDGLVIIENAIPEHSSLDKLNAKMVEDAKLLRDMGEDSPFNYNRGNIQQDAPPLGEWFWSEIFLSKHSLPSTFP